MKTILTAMLVGAALLGSAPAARSQGKGRAARELAESLFGQFGTKVGRSVPELAGRIEGVAARYGDEALLALRKGGPSALGLVEAAGMDGAKAVRVLAIHGEQGAARVLSRPTAMKQFPQHGEEAAAVLCRHPGVAEPLIQRGGAGAVQALAKLEAQSGRRLAMLMEKEVAEVGRHPQLLAVVEKHGERAVSFLWRNKGTIAGGTALTAFLLDPEPFLNGTRDLAAVAGETVVQPVVGGFFTLLSVLAGVLGLVLLAVVGLAYKHGLPSADTVKAILSLRKR